MAGADREAALGRSRRTVGPATAAMVRCAIWQQQGEEDGGTDGRAPRPLGPVRFVWCGGGRQTAARELWRRGPDVRFFLL